MTELLKKLYSLYDDALADLKEARDKYVPPRDREIHRAFVRSFEGQVEGIRMSIQIVKGEAK